MFYIKIFQMKILALWRWRRFQQKSISLPFKQTLLPSISWKGRTSPNRRGQNISKFGKNLSRDESDLDLWLVALWRWWLLDLEEGGLGEQHNTSNRKSHKLDPICESTLKGVEGWNQIRKHRNASKSTWVRKRKKIGHREGAMKMQICCWRTKSDS